MKQFTAVVIGAGGRGKLYTDIMSKAPNHFKVVGIAELLEDRRTYVKDKHNISDENTFVDCADLLKKPKFADIAIIATMDRDHTEHAIKAMEAGYDLLLEKPAAATPEECAQIANVAKKLNRKVLVCHGLRYNPFFKTLKSLLDDGIVGRIITVEHIECVGNAHHSHSFVRGNWGNKDKSSFMLLQKCCHDLDALQWLLNKECKRIQSFGSLSYFKKENAPEGSPERCTDGCPVGDTCPYNAIKLYYDDKKTWFRPGATKKPNPTDEDVMNELKTTQYGKCVFKCDNNVVDHQTVNMEFEDDTTVTLTMSSFAKGTRRLRITGTKGDLIADMSEPEATAFSFYDFATCQRTYLNVDYSKISSNNLVEIENAYDGHAGADEGLVSDLYKYMNGELSGENLSEIGISCKNHMLAFAAEDARLAGTIVDVQEYINKYMK